MYIIIHTLIEKTMHYQGKTREPCKRGCDYCYMVGHHKEVSGWIQGSVGLSME